jgi:hypothetical protein
LNYSIDNIIKFIQDLSGTDKVQDNSDIFGDIGMVGDDFHEMIEKYATKYSVDMSGYLWYFHADEEGQSIGGQFFAAPYERVKRIPVTPEMLKEFANKGKWDIQYPEHKLPKKRYDLLINRLIFGLFSIGLLIWLIIKATS